MNLGSSRRVPLVSIGLPVFNGEATLGLAVRSMVAQTFQDWELLVMDDGSDDRSIAIAREIKDPRVCVISDGNHAGLPARLNQAVALSRGRFFVRMDADDVAYPERLERQLNFLEKNSEVDLVGCRVLVFRGAGIPVGTRAAPQTHAEICAKPWAGFYLVHPTWMGKVEWFRRFPYRDAAIRCEDHHVLLRAHKTSQFANVPEILFGFRENSVSLNKVLRGRYYLSLLVLQEMRARGAGLAAATAINNMMKGLAEIVAVTTGLHYRLLRHRAAPIGITEINSWREVWNRLQEREPVQHWQFAESSKGAC